MTGLWRQGLQRLAQKPASVAGLDLRDGLWRALGHDESATPPALRADVDHPICRLDDVQVVLDQHDRVPRLDERVKRGGAAS